MSTNRVFLDIFILIATSALIGYAASRLIKRGISRKYERSTKKSSHTTPWSALSAGQDPTLTPGPSASEERK